MLAHFKDRWTAVFGYLGSSLLLVFPDLGLGFWIWILVFGFSDRIVFVC